jgi:hypothetical protein
MEPVFQANGEAIIERLVEHAKAANPVALRLCVERLVPLGKHRHVGFQLPPMRKADDVRAAIATIHAGLADGDISNGEAADLLRVADISARMLREADSASNSLASELARHQRALAHIAATLGCDAEALLGLADEDEPMAGAEEAPPIVNNDAETMGEAADEVAAPRRGAGREARYGARGASRWRRGSGQRFVGNRGAHCKQQCRNNGTRRRATTHPPRPCRQQRKHAGYDRRAPARRVGIVRPAPSDHPRQYR